MTAPQVGDTRIQVNPSGSLWRYSIQIFRKWGPWQMFPAAWCHAASHDFAEDARAIAETLHRMHTTYFSTGSGQ